MLLDHECHGIQMEHLSELVASSDITPLLQQQRAPEHAHLDSVLGQQCSTAQAAYARP